MASGICEHCGKECPKYQNYCDWDCIVESAKAAGGKIHCPNGLPVKSVDRDNNMYECEHGDHPDYKFPVEILYAGQIDDSDREEFKTRCGESIDDDKIRTFKGETHALIYNDSSIAITMYECCYSMWHLSDGKLMKEHLWYRKNEYFLSPKSLEMIKAGRYEV